jgi:branched-chain amino acid transport system substrate-binding protein
MFKKIFIHYYVGIFLAILSCAASAQTPLYVGFDGAYGVKQSTSAQAIERGIRIALAEINAAGGVLGGRPLELLTSDNRSVPARGVANIRAFAQNPDVVAVVGGRFSPVLLEAVPVVHELGIILLNAWGSADGITVHDYRPSYTFRLSLRDSDAMPVMLQHALDSGFKRVGLLLPNTGWGRSNQKAAKAWLEENTELQLVNEIWYHWGEKDMLAHYDKLRFSGIEALILVINDIEGAQLVRQLKSVPPEKHLPIICHWGVTGGEMVSKSGDILFDLDFKVVQTFSFFSAPNQDVATRVLHLAERLFGLKKIEDIESPVGLAHGYDLIHLLARAITLADSADRAKIRDALEQVRDYRGLTGTYAQPFTADNHDALRREQVFMARYRKDGALVPLNNTVP